MPRRRLTQIAIATTATLSLLGLTVVSGYASLGHLAASAANAPATAPDQQGQVEDPAGQQGEQADATENQAGAKGEDPAGETGQQGAADTGQQGFQGEQQGDNNN